MFEFSFEDIFAFSHVDAEILHEQVFLETQNQSLKIYTILTTAFQIKHETSATDASVIFEKTV